LYNRCAKRRLFGIDGRGGLAEYMTVPGPCAYALPPNLDAADGALAEPLAVAVRGVRLAGVGVGTRVAVLGGGTIGLLSAVAARAAGASDVQVSARHPFQREMAAALGAGPLEGDEFDVVVETVGGQADTLTQAATVARSGATIAMLGVFEIPVPFPALDYSMKELRLVGSNCYARAEHGTEFGIAVDLLARHRDELRPLVTHRFPIEEINDAFAAAADKTTGAVKVHIQP
jgi:threonine dehydrogenase-like Zn-dependent dehydrogenase